MTTTKIESEQGAPERIWTQLYSPASSSYGIMPTISAYDRDPREVHDNGKPVYVYTRSDICAELVNALDDCADEIQNIRNEIGLSQTRVERLFAVERAARTALAQVKTDDK